MSALSGSLLTLAELARADAKRQGVPASAVNLARVIAQRHETVFEAVFGDGTASTILHAPPNRVEAPTVERALETLPPGADPAMVVQRLRELLGDLDEWVGLEDPGIVRGEDGSGRDPTKTGAGNGSADDHAAVSGHPLLEVLEGRPVAEGHRETIAELLAQLSRRVPGNPLLLGKSGIGRTALAHGLAAALSAPDSPRILAGMRVVRLSLERLLVGDPLRNLNVALNELDAGSIAFIDDLEALLGLASGAFYTPAAMRLRVALERPDQRVVLALDEDYVSRLEGADEDLLAELVPVRIPSLPREDLERIIHEQANALASHHRVEIPETVRRMALAPAPQVSLRAHPGLAVDRLDIACARAVIAGHSAVTEAALGLDETPEVAPLIIGALAATLNDEVRGQDNAVERVVRRVALTRARLDLRPERPDGVLLFVGPTGVGKTQLARTLCGALFGDEDRLVRLDMSEYADSWAISRLIGPQPGYVGFSEPDAWLTTRIRRQPRTVLLLDEIEKGHPAVWNTFLQVFDAGRLTDPRGNVADFRDVVIIMTSNIGSESYGATSLGFATRTEEDQRIGGEERVLAAVNATMRPELINRLDDIIVFHPLSDASIREIAQREVELAVVRLTERGYSLSVPSEVIDLIARVGYDPRYGARHLQRNLERLLLMPLAGLDGRTLEARVEEEAISWVEI